VRVVSYNILSGGVGRADPIAEVLLAQRPDVVGLVEASDPEILDRIAWRLGFDYVSPPSPDGVWGSALLSRYPVLESTNVTALRDDGPRSFLWATLDHPAGPVDVGVLHLVSKPRPKREKKRLKQLEVVFDVVGPAIGRPRLLVGDFNAASPDVKFDASKTPARHREAIDEQGGDVPRAAIQSVVDDGYTDAHAGEQRGTVTAIDPWLRVDYIFTSGCRATDRWIETDRLAEYASDHFPMGAEVAFDD